MRNFNLAPRCSGSPLPAPGDRVLVLKTPAFPQCFATVLYTRGLRVRVKGDNGKEWSALRSNVRFAK